MQPRIEQLPEKKLIGMRKTMSLTDNQTRELWQGFMPRRREIPQTVGTALYSLQQYDPAYFEAFNPAAEFEKWAAMEVAATEVAVTDVTTTEAADFGTIPDGLEMMVLPAGLYAVFLHQGPASEGPRTFEYIFKTWLPHSEYTLDNRPHFELLGEKYKNDAPRSEEEIWIPIKPKNEHPSTPNEDLRSSDPAV